MNLDRFGQLIRSKREAVPMLQKELSEGICTRSMISRIENEDYFPHITIVEKLLDRLGVPIPDWLEQMSRKGPGRKRSASGLSDKAGIAATFIWQS